MDKIWLQYELVKNKSNFLIFCLNEMNSQSTINIFWLNWTRNTWLLLFIEFLLQNKQENRLLFRILTKIFGAPRMRIGSLVSVFISCLSTFCNKAFVHFMIFIQWFWSEIVWKLFQWASNFNKRNYILIHISF